MDALPNLPTIKAAEVDGRASSFAEDLIERLNDLNSKTLCPQMSDESNNYMTQRYGAEFAKEQLSPTPEKLKFMFASHFCTYIAKRFVIVP